MKSLAVALLLPASVIWAEDNAALTGLQEENRQLRNRVDKLENELNQIKHQLAAPPAAALTGEQVARLQTLADSKKKPVLGGLDLELYGYIKLDAAFDSARTSVGNYMKWVESPADYPDRNQFSLTANQTRLGLRITGPALKNLQTSGVVEMDFYGGGAENKPNPMLRLAYVSATWPESGFNVLAGQASDVISPLVAPTINYSVGWWQGDIGYRRPQVRLTQTVHAMQEVDLKFEAAATRTIGRTNGSWTGANYDTGQEAGFPTIQARASASFPLLAHKPTVLGVSGHWGQEEYTRNVNLDTWSVNVDLSLPITAWLTLQAEGFLGADLDAYLGGIGQGINTTTGKTINAYGGWFAFSMTPRPEWQLNVGAGCDDPRDGDLAAGSKTYNGFAFGNIWYFFNPNFSLGLEVAYMHTGYNNKADGQNLREQLSFLYKF